MRRNAADILFVYHYTHRPPSSLSSYRPLSLPLVPFLAGPSSLSSPLPFSLRFSFSCSPPPPLPFLPAARRAYMYLFYFIIKQTSSCHPRANMRLYTYIRDPRQTQSPLDARIGLRDRSRHEKHFFSILPSFRVSFPLHVFRALSESIGCAYRGC